MFQYEKAWQDLLARIDRSARAAGRAPDTVRLLAVSKTFPPAAIRKVHAFGQRAFGENFVQEAVAKIDAVADLVDVEWHMIGPLQGNKTRIVAERFAWVHSVDREKIAARLAAGRPAALPPLNICVQVNISGEATKSGVPPGEAIGLAGAVAKLPRLRLRGLMGIAAPTPAVESRRPQFRTLRALFEDCRAAGLDIDTLSMGMSDDLEVAVAEGATLVRAGTAVFGSRKGAWSRTT
jgi:pyridoxal phosphate enzyme (YggS family)